MLYLFASYYAVLDKHIIPYELATNFDLNEWLTRKKLQLVNWTSLVVYLCQPKLLYQRLEVL